MSSVNSHPKSVSFDRLGSHNAHHDDAVEYDKDKLLSSNGQRNPKQAPKKVSIDSLTFVPDESDIQRAHVATDFLVHRGRFWNQGKHMMLQRYIMVAMVGVTQALVAYFTNLSSEYLISNKYEKTYHLLENGHSFRAFLRFAGTQTFYVTLASLFVWIEPVSAGSGIPEVKCYLNGIDLPRVTELKTLVCKVLGVICSVAGGLPVGKEGPMVHSGAVVATTVASANAQLLKDDKTKRDMVACGAAAGVCTAFSAPIGGILFSLEEGASYWSPSLTWRAFFCSMIALASLYCLNTIGTQFGKVGFDRLFSFGNFIYEGTESSFAVFELALFTFIGVAGGLIGAIFNNVNERITHWRIKNVNYSKKRRLVEAILISFLVSLVSFAVPALWRCKEMPDNLNISETEKELKSSLVAFRCKKGEEYNEIASLMFADAGDAIQLLFHLHHHAFSNAALVVFFLFYISLAVIVYGIAVPSGLFVPSLLR